MGQQTWLDEDQRDASEPHRHAGSGRGSPRTQDVIVALDSDRTFEQGHGENLDPFLSILYGEGNPWTGGNRILILGIQDPDKGNCWC
jgi:hypothetical protein